MKTQNRSFKYTLKPLVLLTVTLTLSLTACFALNSKVDESFTLARIKNDVGESQLP